MTTTVGTQLIINGATQAVFAAYGTTTAIVTSGTDAVLPLIGLLANDALVGTGNSLPVFDSLVVANSGSILTEALALVSQGSTEIALLGSINSVLGAGTVVTSPSVPVTHTLAAGGTVSTGTPVNLFSAGQVNRGGYVQTMSTLGVFFSQAGAAGTVAGGLTTFLPQGSIVPLAPSPNAVSFNATGTVVVSGVGLGNT